LHGREDTRAVEVGLKALLRPHFDMEAIDAEARAYQRPKFEEWKESSGKDMEPRLRECLGDAQYERLRPVYKF
jgi:hypothetical protein